MGLTYPVDIDAWAAWQKRQNTLRWAKTEARQLVNRLRGGAAEQEGPVGGVLYTRGAVPRVLIVLDSFSPTSRGSLRMLRSTSTASTPLNVTTAMPGASRKRQETSCRNSCPVCA